MEDNAELRNLEELAESGRTILIDTSVVLSPYDADEKNMRISEKSDKAKDDVGFIMQLGSAIKKSSEIYFTRMVFDEIKSAAYEHKVPYGKKKSKGINPEEKWSIGLLELYRTKKKRGALLKNLVLNCEYDKIISLNSEESEEKKYYDYLASRYADLKTKHKISDADWEFLVSGVTLSTNRNVALISNDNGIVSTWNDFLKYKEAEIKALEFYRRMWHSNLKKLSPHYRHLCLSSVLSE